MSTRWLTWSLARWRRKLHIAATHHDHAGAVTARSMIDRRKAQIAARTPLRAKALAQGMAKVGVMEVGGNNRGTHVEEIIRYAGGDIGEPWCVDFAIWCYGHAGSTAIRPGAPRAVSSYPIDGTHEVGSPEPGDCVRYVFDHWGMFVRWIDKANGAFEALEGNTGASGARSDSTTGGDGVYLKTRYMSQVNDFLRVDR